jgi:hypothetical protein
VRRVDNLTTFMCRLPENSGSLNLVQPTEPVQACIGIDLLYLIALTRNLRWSGNICVSLLLERFFCPHSLEIGTKVSLDNINSDDWDSNRKAADTRPIRPRILTSTVQVLV